MDLPTLLDSYPVAAPAIDELCGTWYIVKTTLAMWRERRNPTVAYARLPGGAVRLRDEINYLNRAGRPRRLLGIDTQDARDPRIFCWRGAAWYTRLLTSQWCFVDHDPAWQTWAVTYFSATLFTAAGLDIYSRTPTLAPATLAQIEARLAGDPHLGPLIAGLFAPSHG